jgi:hypothetical protein
MWALFGFPEGGDEAANPGGNLEKNIDLMISNQLTSKAEIFFSNRMCRSERVVGRSLRFGPVTEK